MEQKCFHDDRSKMWAKNIIFLTLSLILPLSHALALSLTPTHPKTQTLTLYCALFHPHHTKTLTLTQIHISIQTPSFSLSHSCFLITTQPLSHKHARICTHTLSFNLHIRTPTHTRCAWCLRGAVQFCFKKCGSPGGQKTWSTSKMQKKLMGLTN